MVNEIAQREDEEMEAMFSMMQNTSTNLNSPDSKSTSTSYASDDEEYDNLFISALQELETGNSKSFFPQMHDEDDRMDES